MRSTQNMFTKKRHSWCVCAAFVIFKVYARLEPSGVPMKQWHCSIEQLKISSIHRTSLAGKKLAAKIDTVSISYMFVSAYDPPAVLCQTTAFIWDAVLVVKHTVAPLMPARAIIPDMTA